MKKTIVEKSNKLLNGKLSNANKVISKNDLARLLYAELDGQYSHASIQLILSGLGRVLKQSIISGRSIRIPTLFTITIKDVPGRKFKSIDKRGSSEYSIVPPHKRATVRIAKGLQEALNKNV